MTVGVDHRASTSYAANPVCDDGWLLFVIGKASASRQRL
jgi:hypothetical protein